MLSAVQGPCHSPANILLQTLDKLIHNRLHQQARRILGFRESSLSGTARTNQLYIRLDRSQNLRFKQRCFQPFRSMASFWIMDTTSSGKRSGHPQPLRKPEPIFLARRARRTSGFRPAVRIIINRGQRAVHNHLFLRQLYASPGYSPLAEVQPTGPE